ncbi:MAG: cDP-diacylglycerol--glycerol-3-phosphate 3-phosphatidyltransferase [Chlamydiota bacterium]|jgi:phosphatidylglycerophosphate synthase
MLTVSNGLSFVRAPLALLFLESNVYVRLIAICLAMLTDSVDGYLARRFRSTSQFGAVLDPLMDKFFVYFGLGVLFAEYRLESWEMVAMLSRDLFLCLYGLILLITGKWKNVVFRSIRWGKVTTALQFIVLMGLVCHMAIPSFVFLSFIAMGWLAFLELFQVSSTISRCLR